MSFIHTALRAIRWSAVDIVFQQILRLAISIALARMLSPEEFGTIALLYLFVGIASAFADSGFSSALIQKQDAGHVDESTVFWLNVALGAAMALVLALLAPAIAAFFGIDMLVPLMLVLALNLFVAALGSIHRTLLTKKLDFKTQMVVGLAATFGSGALAIWMAWNGYGIWALAAQTLVAGVFTTVLLWVFNPWRPLLVFSVASARRLFRFGGFMLVSGLLNVAYERSYALVLGRLFGVAELAFYNRADGTKQVPAGVLSGILSRVAFPVFSSAANDPERLRRGVRMALRSIMLINVPSMIGLAALAGPVIDLLFGDAWLPAAPILTVLCLAGILWPLHVINLNVLMAQGHSRLFFRLEVVKTAIGAVAMIGGAAFGPLGVAWAVVLSSILAFLINAHYTNKLLGYGARAQVADFASVLLLALPMGLAVACASEVWDAPPFIQVPALVLAGALMFGTLVALFNVGPYRDAIGLIRWST
ncbi:lipopolysaccharide biosynthesis protein [Parvibaculum sp.]|uniref:lipopolysaccharide biosynthesis protein n=1 Tax=Parvibaculum sp. TaxID=2024848 RepID=UPI001D2BF4A6|nr:lipopolysaccharide biosynthesis protein [Parvibaculum sp.]MBX3489214.1 lipopolysaccharide biosynthesis protein [Parvibaculum sp.]